jgi:hypothetical protein
MIKDTEGAFKPMNEAGSLRIAVKDSGPGV